MESVKKEMFTDYDKNIFNPNFSFKRMREACFKAEQKGELRETIAETAFGQLLRAGIQLIANNWYKIVPVVYPDLVQEVASDKRQEWYAPLYRPQLPKIVSAGGEFEESNMMGVDRELVNWKFGRIEAFERELFDDDQTGQIRQRAGYMGENMKIVEEIYVTAKLTSAAFTFGDLVVTASDYTTPDTTGTLRGVYSTQVGNRPVAFGSLSQPSLEAADIALQNILDPLGNRMLVLPNTLVVSTADKFNAAKLLNSSLQPSVPGAAGQTASTASSGGTGWTMTINPLQGLYDLKVARFLTSGAWYLGEAKKGLVFQRRDPLEVIQELPASGKAFSEDAYRFRTRSRFECEWVESRFWYQGHN